jgi:hypothetical protein
VGAEKASLQEVRYVTEAGKREEEGRVAEERRWQGGKVAVERRREVVGARRLNRHRI